MVFDENMVFVEKMFFWLKNGSQSRQKKTKVAKKTIFYFYTCILFFFSPFYFSTFLLFYISTFLPFSFSTLPLFKFPLFYFATFLLFSFSIFFTFYFSTFLLFYLSTFLLVYLVRRVRTRDFIIRSEALLLSSFSICLQGPSREDT